MNQSTWTTVDDYFTETLFEEDDVLSRVLATTEAAGIPAQNVAANQGQFLAILAQSVQARSILEIGTLGGYSTIWLARTLPANGHLTTLEINADYAAVARKNIELAELGYKVSIEVGAATDTLQGMIDGDHEPFDFIFIDADKQNNKPYFEAALQLSRVGSIIVIDNVVRDGAVVDAHSSDPRVQGVREVFAAIASEKRVIASAIQTVGSKGYDGFAIVTVIS